MRGRRPCPGLGGRAPSPGDGIICPAGAVEIAGVAGTSAGVFTGDGAGAGTDGWETAATGAAAETTDAGAIETAGVAETSAGVFTGDGAGAGTDGWETAATGAETGTFAETDDGETAAAGLDVTGVFFAVLGFVWAGAVGTLGALAGDANGEFF